MITQVQVGHKYVNVSIAVTDDRGIPIDPVSVKAWFYKVSQTDGSLILDPNIGDNGILSLVKQDGHTGFYGNSVKTESLSKAEYTILFEVDFGTNKTITVDTVSIISPRTVDVAAIADAVWDEPRAEHEDEFTFGGLMKLILKMARKVFIPIRKR